MSGLEFWLESAVNDGISGLSARDLAVDVGASIGTWTRPLSKTFKHVVAFEPDPRASSRIEASENVLVVNAAVADCDRTATLFLRPSPDQTSLLRSHPIGSEGCGPAPIHAEIQVSCVSLDNAIQSGADFVKIDIEGGEVDALRGCIDSVKWARTFFIVECHDTFSSVAEELARLGKTVTRVPHPFSSSHAGHCWAIGK